MKDITNSYYLEVDLGRARRRGGEAALEHGPAPGLGDGAAGVDEVTDGLDDRPDVGAPVADLQPRCNTAGRRIGARSVPSSPEMAS